MPLEAILEALGARSMQDPANGLRRIFIPGRWVNKGKKEGPELLTPARLINT
jgi:hypothetical protein